MNEDVVLLKKYAEDNSDAAFRELVTRRIDFVYAAALRQVGGDARLAQEVAQNVFLDLARKARALAGRPNITGWLYTSVRFAAAKVLRSRVRRLNHETEAHGMHEVLSAPSASEANWDELRPVLDATMHELREQDRDAILLRYFEGRFLAEIGRAAGLSENSARMRVDRALEKLRVRLARRGITSTAAALGVALAGQPAVAAPAGVAAVVTAGSLAGTATTGWALTLMSTKLQFGAACAIAAVSMGAYLVSRSRMETKFAAMSGRQAHELAALRIENDRLRQEVERLTAAPVPPAPASVAPAAPAMAASAPVDVAGQQRRVIVQNLRELAKAREQFMIENGRPPASLADLVGPTKYVWRLNPADGEDYSQLEFGDGKTFSVTTAGGLTVTMVTSSLDAHRRLIPGTAGGMASAPSPELLTAITTAIDAFRLAHQGENPPQQDFARLLPYFKVPKEGADYVEWIERGASR